MKEGRVIDPAKIYLVSVQTIKGSIDTPRVTSGIAVEEYDFDFDVSIGVNDADNVIGIIFKVDINALGHDKKKLDLKASYTHEFVFEVENLDEFIEVIEGATEPKVDRLMLGTLLGIVYSTIRGIVYTRTQGTAFNGVILPVVDPKRFIKNDETKQDQINGNSEK